MRVKVARGLITALVLVLASAWSISAFSATSGASAYSDKTVYTRESVLQGLTFVPTGEPVVIRLSVLPYNQNDPAWKTDLMAGTCTVPRTIGAKGCALTSASMVFRYYGALSKNPKQMNVCMGSSACPFCWDVAAASCDENKAVWYGDLPLDFFTMISYLNSGYPPILQYSKAGDLHFAVVTTCNGDWQLLTSYLVNDPWDGMSRSASYWVTTKGYVAEKIRLYRKG